MIYVVVYALWSIVGAVWVIVRCDNPSAAWAWAVAMIVCAPVATLMFYLCHLGDDSFRTVHRFPAHSRLQSVVANGCGAVLTLHNDVRALHNADQTFSSLIRDLQRARFSIDIEYYILSNDRLGRAIASVLMRRARSGVRVRVMYDCIGSWRLCQSELQRLSHSGVEVRPYLPLRFPWLTRAAHRRNHRKLVIVDGTITYLGGINIAGRYMGAGRLGFWRDEHIRIEGSAAHQVQQLFDADWHSAGGLKSTPLHPKFNTSAVCPVQIVWAEEGTSRATLLHAFIEAMASARHNVRIATPYFLPPEPLIEAIIAAARAGVKVELLVPRVIDVKVVALASARYIRRCVAAGVEVYRYGGGFLHSKTIIVDESVVIIGSANVDYRSLYYNMEASAIIYNRAVAADYASRFYADVALSERVNADEESSLPMLIAEGAARLLAPIL